MRTPDSPISLTHLAATGLRLHPTEAVAVARHVILRAADGSLPGIPSASVIRFSRDGSIGIEGPVAAGCSVERAARLLDAMLPGFDSPPEVRTSGALRLVVACALGDVDLPPFRTLSEFADALARFSASDVAAAVSALWHTWSIAVREAEVASAGRAAYVEPDGALTISDVRRARRSTGLTLSDISKRSRIPASLIRELEWGYFVNWPAGSYGRTQLVRYAQAAGLDDQVVIRAVWPLFQEAIRSRGSQVVIGAIVASDVVESKPMVRIEPAPPVVTAPVSGRRRVLAALAIPALAAIALLPAVWNSREIEQRPTPTRTDSAQPAANTPASDVRAAEAKPRQPSPFISTRLSSRPAPQRAAAKPAALRADVAFSPAFASTGSAMFYHSGASASPASAIMRADTDTTGAVLRVTSIVNDTARNFHARPSPDGRLIAFDSDREGERAVYVTDADGREVRRVTGQGFAAVPSWSPDGRRLAYVRAEPSRPRVWNLWTVTLATGEHSRLTSHRFGQPWGGTWFPDGERLAYSHEDRLVVRSIEGTAERIYPSPIKGRLLRTPAVSPDGRRVIFQVLKDGAWMLDLKDDSMVKILSDPSAEEFTWSPDGGRVAYHSQKTGAWGVWVMAAR